MSDTTEQAIDTLAKYEFRDKLGHPLENCIEYRELLGELAREREQKEIHRLQNAEVREAAGQALARANRWMAFSGELLERAEIAERERDEAQQMAVDFLGKVRAQKRQLEHLPNGLYSTRKKAAEFDTLADATRALLEQVRNHHRSIAAGVADHSATGLSVAYKAAEKALGPVGDGPVTVVYDGKVNPPASEMSEFARALVGDGDAPTSEQLAAVRQAMKANPPTLEQRRERLARAIANDISDVLPPNMEQLDATWNAIEANPLTEAQWTEMMVTAIAEDSNDVLPWEKVADKPTIDPLLPAGTVLLTCPKTGRLLGSIFNLGDAPAEAGEKCPRVNPNPLPFVTDGPCEKAAGHDGACVWMPMEK